VMHPAIERVYFTYAVHSICLRASSHVQLYTPRANTVISDLIHSLRHFNLEV